MSDIPKVPSEWSDNTPQAGRKIYALLFLAVAIIGLLAVGLDKIALLPDSFSNACRAFHVCNPRLLKRLPPFDTWQPSGSTWDSVKQTQVPQAQKVLETQNPDYDIFFQEGKEEGSCDGKTVKTNCKYHYQGSFYGQAKWEGLSILKLCLLGIFTFFIAALIYFRPNRPLKWFSNTTKAP